MYRMKRLLCMAVTAACLCSVSLTPGALANNGAEEDNEDVQTKMIALTFRVLAKAFISVSDTEALKEGAITRISKMGEERFRTRYADFYEHIYDRPVFTNKFGLYKDLTKEEAVVRIKALDKQRLYTFVDSLPDIVISNEFKRYLFKSNKEMPPGKDEDGLWDAVGRWIEAIKQKYVMQPKTPPPQ